jgi:hypothetical protein
LGLLLKLQEIEETVKNICGDKALKKMQLYKIIRKVKEGKLAANQRLSNGKRKVRDPTFVTDVTAKVASNRYVTIRKLAQTHGILTKMIHATLHGDLILPKNCAR